MEVITYEAVVDGDTVVNGLLRNIFNLINYL
jgi:hypothetical protein